MRWRSGGPRLRVAALVLSAVGLVSCSRVRAEYYYLRIKMGDSTSSLVGWFSHLEHMDKSAAVPPLVRLLRDEDPWVRAVAARALQPYHRRNVVVALSKVAGKDPDEQVRRAAIDSLGAIGDPLAVPVLRDLGGKEGGVYEALGRLGAGGRDALLEEVRKQPDPERVAYALGMLCQSFPRDSLVVRAMEEALTAEAWQLRRQAATCLGETLGSEAIVRLTTHVDDGSSEVRVAVGEQLARLGEAAGTRLLTTMLRDRTLSDEVRMEAAHAFGRVKDQGAFSVLRDAFLGDPSLGVRSAAQNSLVLLFPPGDPRTYGRESPTGSPSPVLSPP